MCIEMVWVSKLAEPIDENWFSQRTADLILVGQGQLKFEFESPGQPDRVLGAGEVLVLPAGQRCRAYRWPRDAREATIFVAAYPTVQNSVAAERARQPGCGPAAHAPITQSLLRAKRAGTVAAHPACGHLP
jgi:hypothetical protein